MGLSNPSYFINHIIKNKKNMKNSIIVPFYYQAMWLSFVQGLVFTRKDIKDIGMTYSIGR